MCDMLLTLIGILYFSLGLWRTVVVMVDVHGVEAQGKLVFLVVITSRILGDCGLRGKFISLSLVKIRRVR